MKRKDARALALDYMWRNRKDGRTPAELAQVAQAIWLTRWPADAAWLRRAFTRKIEARA